MMKASEACTTSLPCAIHIQKLLRDNGRPSLAWCVYRGNRDGRTVFVAKRDCDLERSVRAYGGEALISSLEEDNHNGFVG